MAGLNGKLLEEVQDYIESTVEGYLNGIRDCGYGSMTKEEWKGYVIESLRRDVESNSIVNGNEFKHLYFFGKKKIENLVDKYIDSYEDIQPYVVR